MPLCSLVHPSSAQIFGPGPRAAILFNHAAILRRDIIPEGIPREFTSRLGGHRLSE